MAHQLQQTKDKLKELQDSNAKDKEAKDKLMDENVKFRNIFNKMVSEHEAINNKIKGLEDTMKNTEKVHDVLIDKTQALLAKRNVRLNESIKTNGKKPAA